MPVLQDLHHIDHVESSPCHHTSLALGNSEAPTSTRNRTGGSPDVHHHHRGGGLPERRVVDYLNAAPGELVDSVLADTSECRRVACLVGPADGPVGSGE